VNLREWKGPEASATDKRKRVESPAKANKKEALSGTDDLALIAELGLEEGGGEGEAEEEMVEEVQMQD
jgi:hypothetical protein